MTTIVTRQGKGSPLSWVEADANFTNLNTDKAEVSVVALKAPLASPDLTGVPTAPTATNGTNTTQLATTAFVQAKTATQTPSTAIGNIVATNVQAALEELDTEKASLTGATFSGQVTATKLQTGVSGTNTNNFILDASAADGTMKLERGDGQDIMTVDAAGKVAFTAGILGFIFGTAATGNYVGLPSWIGGWLIQWGVGTTVGGVYDFNYPTPFNVTPTVFCSEMNAAFGGVGYLACGSVTLATGRVTSSNGSGGSSVAQKSVSWLAIGK